jgi:hypothetical protein
MTTTPVLRSQNGWPVHTDTTRLIRFTAGGRRWWAPTIDVALLATRFIVRYAAEVEPITPGPLDDWSWADRPVRGYPNVISNHASATAWDINALAHPLGTRTLGSKKLAALRALNSSIVVPSTGRPVFRLGADYRTRPDEMHVEVIVTTTQASEAARALAGTRHR